MAIAIHPCISGQPHRIRYLEEAYEYFRHQDGVLMKATSQDLTMARLVGIRVNRTIAVAFALGSALGSLHGPRTITCPWRDLHHPRRTLVNSGRPDSTPIRSRR